MNKPTAGFIEVAEFMLPCWLFSSEKQMKHVQKPLGLAPANKTKTRFPISHCRWEVVCAHNLHKLYSHFRTKLDVLKSVPRFTISSDDVESVSFWIRLIKSTSIQILLLLEQAETPATSVKALPESKTQAIGFQSQLSVTETLMAFTRNSNIIHHLTCKQDPKRPPKRPHKALHCHSDAAAAARCSSRQLTHPPQHFTRLL